MPTVEFCNDKFEDILNDYNMSGYYRIHWSYGELVFAEVSLPYEDVNSMTVACRLYCLGPISDPSELNDVFLEGLTKFCNDCSKDKQTKEFKRWFVKTKLVDMIS